MGWDNGTSNKLAETNCGLRVAAPKETVEVERNPLPVILSISGFVAFASAIVAVAICGAGLSS
jgi:hypothetical protein